MSTFAWQGTNKGNIPYKVVYFYIEGHFRSKLKVLALQIPLSK